MSFKNKMLLAFCVVLILALIPPFLHFKGLMQKEILTAAKNNAQKHLEHVLWLCRKNQPYPSLFELQSFFKETAQSLDIRITLVRPDGKVLTDSNVQWTKVEQMENHALRPEIKEARSGSTGLSIRHSSTLHIDFIYAAQKINNLQGIGPGILRVAMPYSRVEAKLTRLTKQQVYVLILSLLVVGIISWLFTRGFSRQINKISQAAEAIGQGDFERKIDFYPGPDLFPLVRSINKMGMNIRQYIQDLDEQRNQIQIILNGMKEGVLVLNNKGKATMNNVAIHEIFNITGTVIGREPIEFILSPELQDNCNRIVREKRTQPEKMLMQLSEQRFFDVTLIPIRSEKQELEIILVFHDVSELKRLEQIRKDFVANMSHELRTPLTSIKGYAETLMESKDADLETVKSFMHTILKNANNMNQILEDLLQLSRLESKEETSSLEPVNVHSALSTAWEVCMPLAEEKKVTLENDLPGKQIYVLSNFKQLVRVFVNLLDNAIKYSPEEERVQINAQTDNGNWVIAVMDNGPGIPIVAQERVFERFYRNEDNGFSPKIRGTGLGLSICKHIIHNQNGSIWVKSPLHGSTKGTAFYFRLPQAV